jgi:hypothetical protein
MNNNQSMSHTSTPREFVRGEIDPALSKSLDARFAAGNVYGPGALIRSAYWPNLRGTYASILNAFERPIQHKLELRYQALRTPEGKYTISEFPEYEFDGVDLERSVVEYLYNTRIVGKLMCPWPQNDEVLPYSVLVTVPEFMTIRLLRMNWELAQVYMEAQRIVAKQKAKEPKVVNTDQEANDTSFSLPP